MLDAFASYVALGADSVAMADLVRRASVSRPMLDYFGMLAERVLHDPQFTAPRRGALHPRAAGQAGEPPGTTPWSASAPRPSCAWHCATGWGAGRRFPLHARFGRHDAPLRPPRRLYAAAAHRPRVPHVPPYDRGAACLAPAQRTRGARHAAHPHPLLGRGHRGMAPQPFARTAGWLHACDAAPAPCATRASTTCGPLPALYLPRPRKKGAGEGLGGRSGRNRGGGARPRCVTISPAYRIINNNDRFRGDAAGKPYICIGIENQHTPNNRKLWQLRNGVVPFAVTSTKVPRHPSSARCAR